MSGSKTGILTLFFYMIIRITEMMFGRKIRLYEFVLGVFTLGLIALGLFTLIVNLNIIIEPIARFIPSFKRIAVLFSNGLKNAISDGGSSRDATWRVAIELIKNSPFIGIGIGTYTSVSKAIYNFGHLAHNTYLQLAVEWGLPLAILFFSLVSYLLIKVSFGSNIKRKLNLTFRDVLLIFLFGSLAISLNNARIFWFVLGALYCNYKLMSNDFSNRILVDDSK